MSDTIIENDVLHGAAKIAEYMKQLGFDMTTRRCFDWVASGRIPHTKAGVQIISSKSAIRRLTWSTGIFEPFPLVSPKNGRT